MATLARRRHAITHRKRAAREAAVLLGIAERLAGSEAAVDELAVEFHAVAAAIRWEVLQPNK